MATNNEMFDVPGATAAVIVNNSIINKLHVGDVTKNYYNGPPPKDLSGLEEKKYGQLRNLYSEEDSFIQCLPNDDEEFLRLKDHYSPLEIVVEGVPNKLVELCDIIKNEGKIYIVGDAGSGKSTLVKKMCYDWSMGMDYLRKFKFVFNIPMRLVGDHRDIRDYFYNMIMMDEDEYTFDDVKSMLRNNAKEILFFMDGLDEIGECEKSLKGIFDLYPDSIFIITSRYSWNQSKLKMMKFKRCLTLNGFTNDGVEKFRSSYFNNVRGERFYIEKLIETDDKCGVKCVENFKNPLLLQLICYCFKFSPVREALKVPQLYEKMFGILREKCRERNEFTGISDEILNFSLNRFGELALNALKNNWILFNKEEINDDRVTKLGFLRQIEFLDGRTNRKVKKFQPIHKTFLEYLAALYMKNLLVENLMDEFKNKFDDIPDMLIHSKKSKTGSRFSMIIVFLSGLLGENAYRFFDLLQIRLGDAFKSISDYLWLLWYSGISYKNVECFSQSERLKAKCLHDYFKTSHDKHSKIEFDILSELLKHEKCGLKELDLNEGCLNKHVLIKDVLIKDVLIKTLAENKSITKLNLTKVGNEPSSSGICDEVLSENFKCFTNIVKLMPLLRVITIEQDIFIDKSKVHCDFFDDFISVVKYCPNLINLSITSIPIISDYCDSFIDKTVSHTNAITPNKKQKKQIRPNLSDEHFRQLIRNLNENVQELHLSYLNLTHDSNEFNLNRFSDLRVLKLPNLNTETNLQFIFKILNGINCKLECLDLSGYKFKFDELRSLFNCIKTNKSLKYLNLSQSSSSQNALQELCDCLNQNKILEHLNLSYEFHINDEKMKRFFNACQLSQIKEIHLSGWKFEVHEKITFFEINDIVGKFKIQKACFKHAQFHVFCFNDFELISDNVISFFNKIITGDNFELLDVRGFIYKMRKKSRIDSGYFSPGVCENDAPQVWSDTFPKEKTESELIDVKDKLKPNENVKIIYDNKELYMHIFN